MRKTHGRWSFNRLPPQRQPLSSDKRSAPCTRPAAMNALNLTKPAAETAARAIRPFHLAFPVRDIAEARKFYGELLGCPEGRSAENWVDFDFFGHQLVAHLAPEECGHKSTSAVDDHDVPVKHFGVILTIPDWKALAEKLSK